MQLSESLLPALAHRLQMHTALPEGGADRWADCCGRSYKDHQTQGKALQNLSLSHTLFCS